MYKNQLQELAQRSCFNLPAYSCVREGPDHAPRFKATVNFNGEIFESPNYCATLRQAEHAAAEVALNVLLKRGPSQSLAAKVLDETGICKNLLQETAQRVGVSLPVYTTIKGGLGHVPVFSCVVEVGGRVFAGEPAKTKKQAEKNAAMTAWSVIKQLTQPPLITDCEDSNADESDRKYSKGTLSLYKREDRDQQMQPLSRFYGGRSRLRMVNVRERNRLSREGSPAGQYQSPGPTPVSSPPTGERSYESQRFLFNQQPGARSVDLARTHQRSHSLTGIDSSLLPQQEATTLSRGALVSGSGYLARVPLPWQHHQRPSRLSLQSCSDRFELRRPFTEELQLLEREGDSDWLGTLDSSTSMHLQPQQHRQQKQPANKLESGNPCLQNRRALFQSQSERFELKPSLLDELYRTDEEDWWFRGEMMQRERNRAAAMYDCRDKGTYMFYDGNRGSSTGTDDISYSSSYNDDLGTIGSSYRDAVGTPIAGCYAKQGSFSGYDEGLDLPSSYTDFNATSPTASYAGDKVSSYGSFNVDARDTSFFNEDVSKSTFSGYSNAASSSSNVNDDDKGASSSTSIWSLPTQWSMAHLPASPSSTSSAGFQSLGLCPASSIAPPVRVRQMVAVCSAPPPRSMAIDNTGGTHAHALHGRAPSLHDTSSIDAEIATSELFNQLRL